MDADEGTTTTPPRISSVAIKNFRGIREGVVKGLSAINLVVGRNNSGKTTVAEAISRTCIAASFPRGFGAQDVAGRDLLELWKLARAEGASSGQMHVEAWYRSQTNAILECTLQFEHGSADGFALRAATGPLTPTMGVGPPMMVAQPVAMSGPIASFAASATVCRMADLARSAPESQLWRKLLANRDDKVLLKSLQSTYGFDLEQIQLLPDRLLLLYPDYAVPLDSHGDGTRVAARLWMMLAALRSTMLIVEEPEVHQNPASLRGLAGVTCSLARERHIQLFITTHSAECVRAFLDAGGAEVSVFHFSLDDGLLESRRVGANGATQLLESEIDLRTLDEYL